MLSIDLRGKRALVAGIADDAGYGFAIAKALAEAGATVCTGTWPPALNIFLNLLERGKIDDSRRMPDGSLLQFEKIYPLDAAFDTLTDAPEEIRSNKRYKDVGDFSVAGLAQRLAQDLGERPLDIVVHSLANGPEVKKPLLETSRPGYLGGERERLFAGVAGRPAGAADAVGRIVPLAHLHGERARDPRLRRRDVLGQGGARERHAHPRVRSGAQVRRAREHDLGGSTRLPRRQRHREDREDGRLLRGERAAPGAAYGPRGRDHGRLPGELVRKRDHRGHHLRRQGIPRDGRGRRDRQPALGELCTSHRGAGGRG